MKFFFLFQNHHCICYCTFLPILHFVLKVHTQQCVEILNSNFFCVANYLTDFIFFFCNSTRRNSEWKVCDLFNSFLLNFALDFKRLLLVQVQNSAGNFKIGFVHGFPYFKRKIDMIALQIFVENSKKKIFILKILLFRYVLPTQTLLKMKIENLFFIIFYELAISKYSWKKKYTRHFKSGRDC